MAPATIGYLLMPANALLFAGLFFVNKEYGKRFEGGLLPSLWFAFFAGIANTVCFLIAALAEGWHFSPLSLAFGAGIGLCFVLLQVSGVLAAKLGNMSFYSQSFMLGAMVLPFFYGVIWNGEGANWMKILAICLMIASLLLPLLDERKKGDAEKEKKDKAKTFSFYLLCLIAFFANGLFCVFATMLGKHVPESSPFASIFSFSCFIALFAGIGLALAAILAKKKPAEEKAKKDPKTFGLFVLFSSAYGLFNAWGTYTGMEGIARIDALLFFPVSSGICIGLTFLLLRFLYKEKSGPFATIGMGLTLLSVGLFLGSAFLGAFLLSH